MGEIGVCCGKGEVSAVTEICILYLEGQITEPLGVTVGQVLTEGNVSLLFTGELNAVIFCYQLKKNKDISSEVHFS
jgi:hypothetical protein